MTNADAKIALSKVKRRFKGRANLNMGVNNSVLDIQDVIQEAFLDVLKSGKKYTTPKRLTNFIGKATLLKRNSVWTKTSREYGNHRLDICRFEDEEQTADDYLGSQNKYTTPEDKHIADAYNALVNDPSYENLRLVSEGWGPYQIAQRLGTSKFLAMKVVDSERKKFQKEFGIFSRNDVL